MKPYLRLAALAAVVVTVLAATQGNRRAADEGFAAYPVAAAFALDVPF